MYAKSTRPSAKREVQKERSAKRDDQIARPRRAQTCGLRAMRMCPRSGQILIIMKNDHFRQTCCFDVRIKKKKNF